MLMFWDMHATNYGKVRMGQLFNDPRVCVAAYNLKHKGETTMTSRRGGGVPPVPDLAKAGQV